jgi:hypothetical protein
LGVDKLLAAERENIKIAVEIKNFVGLSPITDFYKALGQYQIYILALKHRYPERILYLAMPDESYQLLQGDDLLAEFLQEIGLRGCNSNLL